MDHRTCASSCARPSVGASGADRAGVGREGKMLRPTDNADDCERIRPAKAKVARSWRKRMRVEMMQVERPASEEQWQRDHGLSR